MVCSLHYSCYVVGTTGIERPRTAGSDGGKRQHGRYVLGDLLGRGGMAEVFAGFVMGSHGFQKPVAIKRLLPELATDHVFVERLIGEAKLLVGMQHGNVVSVLDLAREGDDVFLVMEFVDGPSLRQLLKARGSRGLSLGAASYIVQSAAAGLQFAHARPGGAVIHADISPSNLLLTTSGEVRVADFGIARREGLGEGIVEGKWAYMAPEQVRGETLTPGADVFALGIVMYELICGQHPLGRRISGSERESQPLRIAPPRVVRSTIPAGLDAICMRALAQDPADRYASMQEMIDAIVDERFANGYREGASDLAAAIREVDLGSAAPTQVMDRPVTIVTRSLLLATGTQPGTQPGTVHIAAGSAQGPVAVVPPDAAPMVAPMVVPVAAKASGWWKYAVLGAAAVVGGAAAVVLQMQPDPLPPVATMTQQPVSAGVILGPAPAAAVVPVAVVPVAVVPAAVAPAAVAPPPVAVVEAPVHRVKPHAEAPVVVAKKAPGVLRVTSDPWAYVVVDDSINAETPSAKFTLAAGRHTIRLKNGETGATLTRTVTVGAGETALVRVRSEDW